MRILMARFGTICLLWLMGAGISFAQNPYYDHGTFPATGTLGTSAGMRAELDLIEAGFAKLPTLSGNANKIIVVNPGATALTATDAPIPSGTTFPASPSTNALFLSTDDSVDGACDSDAGSSVTLCRWDGSGWAAVSAGGSFWPSSSTLKEITWANALANAALFGNGTNKWALYNDPTDGLQFVCVIAGVANDCNYIRKLASGKTFSIKNSAGTEILTVTESTGAITNAKFDAEGTGNTLTLKRYKWYPAAGCNNTTASTIWDLPASNPAVAVCRTGTNTTKGVLEFADGSDLSAQLTEYLFEDWTGAIDATIIYEANSTSTNNVVWQLAIACAGDADSDDPAFTYDEFTADAGKATAHQYNATASNTITTTGTCTAGDIFHMSVRRNSAHASDNLAATARLVGVAIKLREAQ